MMLSRLSPMQILAGFISCLASALVACIGASAAASWGAQYNQQPASQLPVVSPDLWLVDQNQSANLAPQGGGYTSPEVPYLLQTPHQANKSATAEGGPAFNLFLEELPVDSEVQNVVPNGPAAEGKAKDKPQKGAKRERASLLNFLRRPTLAKLLLIAGVVLASFFLAGMLMKFAHLLVAGYLIYKLLRYFAKYE